MSRHESFDCDKEETSSVVRLCGNGELFSTKTLNCTMLHENGRILEAAVDCKLFGRGVILVERQEFGSTPMLMNN